MPLSRPRASVAKSVPSTEANKRTSRPASSRWSRRRPITSRTPFGTRTRRVNGSDSWLSFPSAARSRTASPTNRGLPLVSRCSAETSRGGSGRPWAAATSRATSASLSPTRLIRRVGGSRHSSVTVVAIGWSGVNAISRYVPRTSSLESPIWPARNCRSRREGVSAAWRSSNTTTSGSHAAARNRNDVIESNNWNLAESASTFGGAGRSANEPRISGSS